MTIVITKSKLAIAILAAVLVVPATAMATHVFDDVADGKFYAGPVEWAFDNEITTGTSPTTFSPEDDVTRGEAVTFLKRYHDAFGPVGHATVLVDGSIVAARSVGVTNANVDLEATSAFCFYDLDFEFTTVQVSPLYDWDNNEEVDTSIEVGYPDVNDGATDCDGTDPLLEIATTVDSTWKPHPFTITFFG
ncbi:MAG: hypothetical protein DHS20C19_28790 [Acidimicrobiales bacterium]|nr:MAG: hypothetical protein DHS20C19_28790 [Acidimicrobiales bacterium]